MIRHGRTDWNDASRIQGRTDIALNQQGRNAQATRRIPHAFQDAEIWSSPLVRALETAQRLRPGCNVRTDERLIEMDFGTWEGRTYPDLIAADPEGMLAAESLGIDMRPPDGETPREVGDRLLRFLIGRCDQRIVIVCHKGVMRAAFARAIDWDMRQDLPFKVNWNAGQLFRWDDEGLTLEQANVSLSMT